MRYYEQTPEGKDPQLWDIAKKRASFKYNLGSYLIMSVVFWIIWYLSGGPAYNHNNIPWPVWPMFGWGIGVLFHYRSAYIAPMSNAVDREYEKLKQQHLKP
ncbi:MAG: 2TM domain-containing protein [Chitinophagaceae bacterium]